MSTFRIGLDDAEILPEVFTSYADAYDFCMRNVNHSKHFKVDIEERNDDTVSVTTIYEEW